MKSKHILSFGSLINEEKGNEEKNFYSKFWITEIKKEFGDVKVDKIKKIKPLYGGGDYTFIGYEVKLDDSIFSKLILEGMAMNGCFMRASIILYKANEAIMHGVLDIDYNFNDKLDDSISKTIKAIKKKIAETKKK